MVRVELPADPQGGQCSRQLTGLSQPRVPFLGVNRSKWVAPRWSERAVSRENIFPSSMLLIFCFCFLDFYLFIFREGGRKEGREGEKH